MIKGVTPTAWDLAANEGLEGPLPVAADPYWEDISLQASARLARLEDERTQRTLKDETAHLDSARPFAQRTYRLVLMVAVGAIVCAAVVYLLLKAVPTAALPP